MSQDPNNDTSGFHSPKRSRSLISNSSRIGTQGLHQQIKNAGAVSTIFGHSNCPICFDDLNTINFIQSLPCGHSSCDQCLFRNISNGNNKCHTCREEVFNVFSTENNQESIQQFKTRMEPSVLSLNSSIVIPSLPPLDFVIPSNNTDQLVSLYNTYDIDGESYGNIILMPKKAVIPNNSDVLLIIDNSPSMRNNIKLIIEATIEQINNIKPEQRLAIIIFNSVSKHLFALQPVTPENKQSLINLVRGITLTGGTNYDEPFKHAYDIFREADIANPIGANRKKLIIFLSDGEPQHAPDLNILANLDATYPYSQRYIISIGNDVNAEQHLIPLLMNRSMDLGKYYHCGNIDNFKNILAQIHGDNTDMYASSIKIIFENVIPIVSNFVIEEGNYIMNFPVLNYGNSINISFKMSSSSIIPTIRYIMELIDHSPSFDFFQNDIGNIIPSSLTIFFTKNKLINTEINLIMNNEECENSAKCAKLILLKTRITEEFYGIYYQEIINNLDVLIENLTDVEYGDYESQNTLSQMRQMSNSDSVMSPLARQASNTLSQII